MVGQDEPGNSNFKLYHALARIRDVLQTRKYSFVNLSIGPSMPIEDYDVHAWSAHDLIAQRRNFEGHLRAFSC